MLEFKKEKKIGAYTVHVITSQYLSSFAQAMQTAPRVFRCFAVNARETRQHPLELTVQHFCVH